MGGRIIHGLSRLFERISSVFLLLMMLHVTADVFMKYFFNAPIEATIETVTYYYMIGVVFLPLAAVELQNEHIFVDLFVKRFSPRLQLAFYVFACLCGMLYFGILTWQTLRDAIRATAGRETVMANFLFYVWPSRWALPIGMGCMVLALGGNLFRALRSGQALEPAKAEEV
ncbi:MAG: TRAP transporter small permease [Desulfobacterales bacterium]